MKLINEGLVFVQKIVIKKYNNRGPITKERTRIGSLELASMQVTIDGRVNQIPSTSLLHQCNQHNYYKQLASYPNELVDQLTHLQAKNDFAYIRNQKVEKSTHEISIALWRIKRDTSQHQPTNLQSMYTQRNWLVVVDNDTLKLTSYAHYGSTYKGPPPYKCLGNRCTVIHHLHQI